MPVKATPVGARVLVRKLEASETTNSGIVLPDDVRKRESRAVVVEVGAWYRHLAEDGIETAPLSIAKGDVVVYAEGRGTGVVLDLAENGMQEPFIVLDMNDVLLVLQEVESSVRR